VAAVAPSRHHLTPQHVDVLQLSLLAHNYSLALEMVEEDLRRLGASVHSVKTAERLALCPRCSMTASTDEDDAGAPCEDVLQPMQGCTISQRP
jgi:hypothetical protein